MKRILLIIIAFTCVHIGLAQRYNTEKIAFTNFLQRMYNNAPFEGVRAVVDDSERSYLLSVVILDKSKYPNESVLNRVASVKGMSQASRFFNGANITSDLIIRTSEESDGTSDTEIIENIKENSVGYVRSLELLTSFDEGDKQRVFLFIKQINLSE